MEKTNQCWTGTGTGAHQCATEHIGGLCTGKWQEAVQNAPITVQKVNGLSKDFVNGVDVSSYLSLVESGAKYYDEKGDETDLFDLLENAGVNYVRLRVWNDPFPWDEDGNYKYVGADGTTEYKAAAVPQAGIIFLWMIQTHRYTGRYMVPVSAMWQPQQSSERKQRITI